MGYRSDIAITISKEVMIPEIVKKHLDDIFNIREHDNHSYYECIGAKWYDSYEEVIVIENFLNSLESDDFGFIRLGDDYEDIEVTGSPSVFNLFIHRSFSTCYMT